MPLIPGLRWGQRERFRSPIPSALPVAAVTCKPSTAQGHGAWRPLDRTSPQQPTLESGSPAGRGRWVGAPGALRPETAQHHGEGVTVVQL